MKRHLHILCLILAMIMGAVTPSHAASTPNEAQVKAAILFNLARFSEWSDHHDIPDKEFRLCAYTNDMMLKALTALSGKSIHKRRLRIVALKNTKRKSKDCEVIFISSDKGYDYFPFEQVHKGGVLTVSDSAEFVRRGGCMSIQRMGNKIKFSINKNAMRNARIRPSSKIITLAVEPR